ncbi:hypothetical protein P22_1528 [Propionispora sp. 2/2-37]|uniref:CAP domain-containing protein n=1 Tax=Propionispora sp. 2/2-37 TaxID=1677858 RepID=UPI0006BB7D44|nr:CAP domain-containing protein [Propionispora sp. 2/2-37]CUH95457.1 hypothetical protein P22_1528 [Propionispora sp. 2/2-37]
MRLKKFRNNLMFGFLVVSILSTSFVGAFASAAQAAAAEQEVTETSNQKSKDLITGLLAVGLLAILAGGGHDDDKAAASNSSTGNTSTGDSQTTGSNSSTPGSSSEVQQAFTLLNQDRAKNGLPALKLNSQLSDLADAYAADMISRNYFSHYNPEGQSPFDRMQEAGISYTYAGENLATNTSVAAAETAFMNSSGHRANILSTNFTEVGLGVRHAANGSVYVVQEFIKP